jgi:hypothetical protein
MGATLTDTPRVRECIEHAVDSVALPPFSRDLFSVSYPVHLH